MELGDQRPQKHLHVAADREVDGPDRAERVGVDPLRLYLVISALTLLLANRAGRPNSWVAVPFTSVQVWLREVGVKVTLNA